MIGEPVISERDLATAIEIVRIAFALNGLSPEASTQIVRDEFSERWPAWGDTELVKVMRAALVMH